tara:strand:+ start:208 stop:615 length:408 start_codon:yes stop_codon:yes gene_type:complete
MGLVKKTTSITSASGSGSAPKTVSIRLYGNHSLVLMYTVPAGKKFVGKVGTDTTSSNSYYISVLKSGGDLTAGTDLVPIVSRWFLGTHMSSSSNAGNVSIGGDEGSVTLQAGDTLYTDNNSATLAYYILGTESDA